MDIDHTTVHGLHDPDGLLYDSDLNAGGASSLRPEALLQRDLPHIRYRTVLPNLLPNDQRRDEWHSPHANDHTADLRDSPAIRRPDQHAFALHDRW